MSVKEAPGIRCPGTKIYVHDKQHETNDSTKNLDHLFVGELLIQWRRMSRGVSYHRQYDCFSYVRKLPIISGLSELRLLYYGNLRYKGPPTRKAFWCHRVMMQAYSVDIIRETCASGPGTRPSSGLSFEELTVGLAVWLDVFSISENYTSHMVCSCCNM